MGEDQRHGLRPLAAKHADELLGLGLLEEAEGGAVCGSGRRGGVARIGGLGHHAPMVVAVAGSEPGQAAVEFDAGRVLRMRASGNLPAPLHIPGLEEFVDHPPLLTLVDIVHLHNDFADLPGLVRRQLIEHCVGRGRIEAGHQDSRLAKSFVGKFHGHLAALSNP